jgi:hypothetical protein
MMIQLEMGSTFKSTVDRLGSSAGKFISAVTSGLRQGASYAASNVKQNYLSGQSLKSRTGMLRRSVDSWLTDETTAVIGVPAGSNVDNYKWLLSDQTKTITPKRAKFLTIPIAENLTASGVPRYTSPRQKPDGFFIRSDSGKLLYGYKNGKRGRFRPLFVLVKSVTVTGSGALAEGVADSVDDIKESIQANLNRLEAVD